jgi:hypothetical protein
MKFLRDRLEPKFPKSKMESAEPILLMPYSEKIEPMRAIVLTDKLEPRIT